MPKRGIHTLPNRGATDEWLTPPEIIEALGPFDLDPAAPVERPWPTAGAHYTIEDDGLSRPWFGRVWLNPPYGAQVTTWLERLADHGRGTALIAARTETEVFHRFVWGRASALLFFHGRLFFHYPDGRRAKSNAGHGSVLVAYGDVDADRLALAALGPVIRGVFLDLNGDDLWLPSSTSPAYTP